MSSILMSIAFMIAFLCSDIKRRKILSQKETTVLMAHGPWLWERYLNLKLRPRPVARFCLYFLFFISFAFLNCPRFWLNRYVRVCDEIFWPVHMMTSASVVLWIPTAHKFMYLPVVKKHQQKNITKQKWKLTEKQ